MVSWLLPFENPAHIFTKFFVCLPTGQSNQNVEASENESADDEFDEVRSGRDVSESNDAELSAADREAIEKAQQLSPVRPRRSAAKATYAPTCSPNGTEIAPKGEKKKSKRDSEPATSSNSNTSKKRKAKTPTSSLAHAEEKPKKRTAALKKANGSSQNQSIDLIDSEEDGGESVSSFEEKNPAKGRKKQVISDDEAEGEDEISQTKSVNHAGNSQIAASQNGHGESQENEADPKHDGKGKEKPAKSSKKKEVSFICCVSKDGEYVLTAIDFTIFRRMDRKRRSLLRVMATLS